MSKVLKILKVIGFLLLGVLILLLLLVLSLKLPVVQQYITSKVVGSFEQKTNTEAQIGRLYVDFPGRLTIEELYVEDLSGDTLIYSALIRAETDLMGLLKNRLVVSDLEVNRLISKIYNTKSDSTFNYQFIVDAFSGSSPEPAPDTSARPFVFSIKEAEIKNSRVNYHDLYYGTKVDASIGHFYALVSTFDLLDPEIFVDQLVLENTKGNFTILGSPHITPPDTTPAEDFTIGGRSFLMNHVELRYIDEPGKMKVTSDLGKVEVEMKKVDISESHYEAENIMISDTFVGIDIDKPEAGGKQDSIETGSQPAALTAAAGQVMINNFGFRFYDNSLPQRAGFDPAHLWFTHVSAALEAIHFENGAAQVTVKNMKGREKGGIDLKKLSGEFYYSNTGARGENLSLITSRSNLSGDLSVSYPSLETIGKNPGDLLLKAEFATSTLGLEDVLYFQPALLDSIPVEIEALDKIIFETEIKGRLNDLTINTMNLQAFQKTSLQVNGKIKGLPEAAKASYDLQLERIATTAGDLHAALPDTLLPEGVAIPAAITLSGAFTGEPNDFTSQLLLRTSFGNLEADVKMAADRSEQYSYTGTVSVDGFDIGRLLERQELIGLLTFDVAVDGSGFTAEDMDAKVKGEMVSLEYNGYTYKDLAINGHLRSGEFSGALSMNDPNLDFNFNGLVDLNDTVPEYSFVLELKAVDLEALNFSPRPLALQGRVVSDIKATSLKDMNGTLAIQDFQVTKDSLVYQVDTFRLSSVTSEEMTDITLFSRFLEAQFKGNFDLATLPDVLRQHVNRYYTLIDSVSTDTLKPQQFNFEIKVKEPQFFTELLVPGLMELEPGPIEGSYNSQEWALDINVSLPKVVYDGITIDSLAIDIHSDEEYLGYEAALARLASGNLAVENVLFTGLVEANHVDTDVMILDDEGREKYHWGGIFIRGPEYSRFQFTPGEFVLNYDSWEVKPSNSIDFYPSGVWIENLLLSRSGQQISIQSGFSQTNDSLLQATVENFDLRFLGKFAETKEFLISGMLNGRINIITEAEKAAFTSDLTIDQFSFKGDTLGDVTLHAAKAAGNVFDLNLQVMSKVNNIVVKGNYIADSIPVLDMNAYLTHLDLTTIEGFVEGNITDLQGWINGKVQVKGTLEDPDIIGELNFNETVFKVNYLQSVLSIPDETIVFDEQGIFLDNFTILDQNEKPARINGRITTKDYSLFRFNMTLNTREFMLLNTTEEDNELYYGNLRVNSTARITGTSLQPNVRLNVSLEDGSHLTYIIPEEEIQLQEREGVVVFFDKSQGKDSLALGPGERTIDTLAADFIGMELNAAIDIDRNSTLNIIIDPATGDKLTVQGDANLLLDIKPSGDMTLTGRYQVYEGMYNLNFYGLVKREFEITEGSSITWTGDPLNAQVDITAAYTVDAVYEVPGSELQVSQQKAPFIVFLDIKNELLAPDISFRLALDESASSPGAEAFLANVNKSEDEVNAQVFYLLLFQTTKNLESYSTTGTGGSIAESTARNSASRILSNQLNKLAGRLEGIELTFDLQSYNTASSEDPTTQLELGVSKGFFNDRVIVKIAGNFDLEGKEAEEQQGLSDFAGDIRVEYKLTKDGRYRLFGFRENDYDNLLQGEIIKTGAGVIFVRDYNDLKELFNKIDNEKTKE